MILSELTAADLAQRTRTRGVAIRCGPFVVRVVSPIRAIADGIGLLYPDYPLVDPDDFADIHMEMTPRRGLRRLFRPQVVFTFDGEHPLSALALSQAYPLFEWAFNWCIASTANQYLILHAAVVERGGRVLIMPGPPGSGKSTLTAGLVGRDWRLFSDELTLIDTEHGNAVPFPRPISLKNESVNVIRDYLPGAVFNQVVHNTLKGSVVHMKVPTAHVRRAAETAGPGWIVFPKYVAGATAKLVPRSRADTVLELGRNSFNYHIHGRLGFDALADLVEASACYDFEYGDLDEAIAIFDRLAPAHP